MTITNDRRPPVAVGHVQLPVQNISNATDFLKKIGLRLVFENKNIAVLELRGGTHLIIEKKRIQDRKGKQAPVDFMVDNLKEARDKYAKIGLKPTPINKGKVHSSFYIPGPSGWVFKITSTHVTNLPV